MRRTLFLSLAILSTLGAAPAQTDWRLAAPAASPPARFAASMVYDPVRERTVLLGGLDAGFQALADAWEWDGALWSPIPALSGPLGLNPTAAYDPVLGGVLVTATGFGQDGTWLWNGVTWSRVATGAQSPPFRAGAAMSRANNGVLMFGGGPQSNATNETWMWNGVQWTQLGTATTPSQRTHARMVYDESRGTVLMSGGVGGSSEFQDTWEWNGTNWTVLSVGAIPAGWSMVYDSSRDRVVRLGFDSTTSWATHELDRSIGAASPWVVRNAATTEAPTTLEFAMAFDAARAQTVMFGGVASTGTTSDTWFYETVVTAQHQTFGSGCASDEGVVEFTPFAGSRGRPWTGETLSLQIINAAQLPAVMMLGFDASTFGGVALPVDLGPFGAAGCELTIAPLFALPVGPTSWMLAIPDDPTLANSVFFNQLVALGAPNAWNLAFSNAGLNVIGSQ